MAFHFKCPQCQCMDKNPCEVTPIRVHCSNCDAVYAVVNNEPVRVAECPVCKQYAPLLIEGEGTKYGSHVRPSPVTEGEIEECPESMKWCLAPTAK